LRHRATNRKVAGSIPDSGRGEERGCSGQGVQERNLSVEERNLGVEERNLGVEERIVVVEDWNLGVQERNSGVGERNLGAEKRIELCACCMKDTICGINSGNFLWFLFQARTQRSHLCKWQDVSCGVTLNATEGYRLRNTTTETAYLFSYTQYICILDFP
jgi:hypothetical protein